MSAPQAFKFMIQFVKIRFTYYVPGTRLLDKMRYTLACKHILQRELVNILRIKIEGARARLSMKSYRLLQRNTGAALKNTEIMGRFYNNETLRRPSSL